MFKNCAWFISLLVHFHFDGWFLLDLFFTYSLQATVMGEISVGEFFRDGEQKQESHFNAGGRASMAD